MSEHVLSPARWANELTVVLNAAYGADRFPVDIKQFAKDYSHHRYPHDPITLIKGDSLPGFDGGLFRAPAGKKGWGIIYNTDIASPGRINFTLAHEFGHYLLHRKAYPDGIQCNSQDMVRWDSEYGQVEQQANTFASNLLMPLDDFRRQVDAKAKPTLDDIGECAERYRVSLIAATLRWLEYTERRSILVVSRDGFILWARSSKRALKTGAYFKTAGGPPTPIPENSIAVMPHLLEGSKGSVIHDPGSWFLTEACEEIALISEQYDFAISLLHLDAAPSRYDLDEEPGEDVFETMTSRTPGSSWLG